VDVGARLRLASARLRIGASGHRVNRARSILATAFGLLVRRITVCLLATLAPAGLARTPVPALARPPNLILILADDLGQRDLGCYGSSFYETPYLDRLAAEGLRFTDAYAAAPVCSPTRSALMTGQSPARTRNSDFFGATNGFRDGIPPDYHAERDARFPAGRAWQRDRILWPAPYLERLASEHTTLAEALRESGYATLHAGKWHLGPEGSWPEDHGFEVNRGGWTQGGPYGGKQFFSPYENPRLANGPDGEHIADRLAEECARFIDSHSDRPFFINLWFYDVHIPLMAKPALVAKYEAKRRRLGLQPLFGKEPPGEVRLNQDHAVYAAMIETMDSAVGRVLRSLDERGLRENTLIIFTSDNGGLSTEQGLPTSNRPWRAGKGWLYEGGLRVPLIARWPSVVKPGTLTAAPTTSADLYPTLLAAAGLPPRPAQHLDGRSLLPILRGDGSAGDRPLFWHYPHYGNQGGTPGAAIRRGDWKLIEFFEDGRIELYDLRSDPEERTNRATREPSRADALGRELRAWQEEVAALLPSRNPAVTFPRIPVSDPAPQPSRP
jgi:arylsulfatase A-like enzyme